MPGPFVRVAAGAACVALSLRLDPAVLGAVARAPDARAGRPVVVATRLAALALLPLTYLPGCSESPPRVRTTWTSEVRPAPRAEDAAVEVVNVGQPAPRTYEVVGTVQVSTLRTGGSHGGSEGLLGLAKREARRMGGDALVEVREGVMPAGLASPCGGWNEQRDMLSAQVARWR